MLSVHTTTPTQLTLQSSSSGWSSPTETPRLQRAATSPQHAVRPSLPGIGFGRYIYNYRYIYIYIPYINRICIASACGKAFSPPWEQRGTAAVLKCFLINAQDYPAVLKSFLITMAAYGKHCYPISHCNDQPPLALGRDSTPACAALLHFHSQLNICFCMAGMDSMPADFGTLMAQRQFAPPAVRVWLGKAVWVG